MRRISAHLAHNHGLERVLWVKCAGTSCALCSSTPFAWVLLGAFVHGPCPTTLYGKRDGWVRLWGTPATPAHQQCIVDFFIGHARWLPASLFINILSWECWVCMKINKFCRSLDQGISLIWDNVLGVTSFLVLPSPSAHLRCQCLWCSWVVIACWTWNWECRPIAVLNANVHGIRSSRKIIRISLSVKVRLRVILMMRKFKSQTGAGRPISCQSIYLPGSLVNNFGPNAGPRLFTIAPD